MIDEQIKVQEHESRRKARLYRRAALIGLGVLIFVLANWAWLSAHITQLMR